MCSNEERVRRARVCHRLWSNRRMVECQCSSIFLPRCSLVGAGAAGGGSGSYSEALLTAAQIGASQTVTVGTGGPGGANTGGNGGNGSSATSLGTLCVGNPGQGGGGTNTGAAGAGGTAGTGDLTVPGNGGEAAKIVPSTVSILSSRGGAGPWGGQALGSALASVGAVNGASGTGCGAGGNGGISFNSGGAASGGAGANGCIYIDEYNSQ